MSNSTVRLSSSERTLLESMKEAAKRREKGKGEILKQTMKLSEQTRKAHDKLSEKLFKEANIDFESFKEHIIRLHGAQNRQAKSSFAKIRKTNQAKIKTEIAARKKLEKVYRKKFGKDMDALLGNPELKFVWAADQESYVTIEPSHLPLEGGGSHTEFSEWSYDLTMSVDYRNPEEVGANNIHHEFSPGVWTSTGDFDVFVPCQIKQGVFLYRPPLQAGRGNFHVTGIAISLSGTGYAEARIRDMCPFLLDSRVYPRTDQIINLSVAQNVPAPLLGRIIQEYDLWQICPNFNDYVDVNLNPIVFPCSFFLASPDVGGEGIMIHFELFTYASCSDKHGWASADFTQPISSGLRLSCIRLIGEYMG